MTALAQFVVDHWPGTRGELARAAEVSRPYLTRILKGECAMPTDVGYRLAVALGVTLRELLRGGRPA